MKKALTWILSILISAGIGLGLCLALDSNFGRETLQETLATIFCIIVFIWYLIEVRTDESILMCFFTSAIVGGLLGALVGYLVTKPGIGHVVVTIIFAGIGCYIAHSRTREKDISDILRESKKTGEETQKLIDELKEKYGE